MVYLIGLLYIIGIGGAIMLIRRKSYFAIPVIVAIVGLDMLLGSSVVHSHLESSSIEYSGLSYLGLSAFLFIMMAFV
ncbi:hypothetical protein [Peribacillus kribbensis]|uniref:hypothetical protein n=1 Tax=Peribacillus kribbensis TaxID=356658 RepID=UPI00040A650C|nr:hypothetical protein [Peribacillus kribbensis]